MDHWKTGIDIRAALETLMFYLQMQPDHYRAGDNKAKTRVSRAAH